MSNGFDLSNTASYRLMQGRLGVYNKYKSEDSILDSKLVGIQNQERRLDFQGGDLQQQRMIADKRRTLKRAVQFSYQGANVKKVTEKDTAQIVRALINPNKLKQDYDDKIISIFYDYDYKPGDVFEWVGTNTYWLIYLQDLTELAYFRGDIRKCSNEIAWEDEDGLHKTYAAIRGPVETKIDYIQKHGISVDNPNYSLNILMPKTEATIKYFKRYSKFYLQGDKEYNVCWRVKAVDWISMPGILEINATEYYRNETEDDIEAGLVGTLVTEPVNPNSDRVEEIIQGETFIKPKRQYTFTYIGNTQGSWTVGDNTPVQLEQEGKTVKLRWLDTYSGEFELCYADKFKKTIVVESLF